MYNFYPFTLTSSELAPRSNPDISTVVGPDSPLMVKPLEGGVTFDRPRIEILDRPSITDRSYADPVIRVVCCGITDCVCCERGPRREPRMLNVLPFELLLRLFILLTIAVFFFVKGVMAGAVMVVVAVLLSFFT